MLHFLGKKVDCLVDPDHKMLIQDNKDFEQRSAKNISNKKKFYKFKSKLKFPEGSLIKFVNVIGTDIPVKLYLKILGYVISEGCIYENFKNSRYDAKVHTSQLISSDCYQDMKNSFDEFAGLLNKKSNNKIRECGSGYSENNPKEKWETSIYGKELTKYFKDEIGINGDCKSINKRVPRWVMGLHSDLLKILLETLVKGDGTESFSTYGTNSHSFRYSTISKQLADDVYEIICKIGFVPTICLSHRKFEQENDRSVTEYIVMWSDTNYGNEPRINTCTAKTGNGGGARVKTIDYNGPVLEIISPTGLVLCRRNNKLTVQGDGIFDDQTEVYTRDGFRKIGKLPLNPNYVNGVELENDKVSAILTMKEDFKVACLNAETNQLEYHQPTELHMSQYKGEMINFLSRNLDILVTPNHKMWTQKRNRINDVSGWSQWEKIKAQDIKSTATYRFRGVAEWQGSDKDTVDILSTTVPIKIYLKFLGYLISEGYLGQNYLDFIQKVDSNCIEDIQSAVRSFADLFNKTVYERQIQTKDYLKSGFKQQPSDRWNARIYSKELMNYFIGEVCQDQQNTTAEYKKIPTWIKSLNKDLLEVLLQALVFGDGSNITNKCSNAYKYYTTSKQLSDDVQEIVFKCGFSPSIYSRRIPSGKTEYCVSWSNAADGNFPILTPINSYPDKINKTDYEGMVWCFEVPTGLFVTRRNGKITIQGNSKYAQADNVINPLTLVKIGSADYRPTFADLEAWREVFESAQYDKDFKIFTHEGVAVERVGYGQGIFDISGDITQIIKEIYVGLQVPPVLMDGGADTTYANGGVALDVLRQRYMQFRNMMSQWLKRKIFAPISKIQGFYDYSGGEKQLIVPEIDWNHMSLFDAGDYIQGLVGLTQGEGSSKRASLHTLYRSMGLEYEDEQRKIRREAIQDAINKKEKAALDAMDLNALRALDEEDEISEIEGSKAQSQSESPLPGETPGGAPPAPMPGLDLGAPPLSSPPSELPPPPSSPPGGPPIPPG